MRGEGPGREFTEEVDVLVRCQGPGLERTFSSFPSFGFWQPDPLPSETVDAQSLEPLSAGALPIAVIGCGDGGISDAIRILTHGLGARRILENLEDLIDVACLRHFFAEEDATIRSGFFPDISPHLDKDRVFRSRVARMLSRPGVSDRVTRLIKVRNVVVFASGQDVGPCFALNRFLIHLFNQAWPDSRGLVAFGCEAERIKCGHNAMIEGDGPDARARACFGEAHTIDFKNGTSRQVSSVLIRAGIERPPEMRRLHHLVPPWTAGWEPESRAALLGR